MVHPCLGYNIKGVIWYQGENDIWEPELYAELFKSLILDWRKQWKKKDMPFLYVQISLLPGPDWGDASIQQSFREKQNVTLPNTGMVYSLDIGDPYDVHPRNKKSYRGEIGRSSIPDCIFRESIIKMRLSL